MQIRAPDLEPGHPEDGSRSFTEMSKNTSFAGETHEKETWESA